MKHYSLFILLTLFAFISCDPGIVFQHEATIENNVWKYDQVLEYDIDVKDTSEYYELVAITKFNPEFSYENFYLQIVTAFPSGEKADDVVSFQLADKMGSWVADCSGKTCTSELILQDRFRFKEVGQHKLSLINYSREELEGIQAIEIKLYEISKQ